MKYQQKSIGNPVKIYLEKFNLKLEIKNQKFNWKFKWTFEIHEISIQLSFQWISVDIWRKHQWKSIGNQVEISMKYQWKSIANPVEISMEYHWKSIGNQLNTSGNSFEIQLNFNRNFNKILIKIHFNPVGIQ